MKIYPISSLGDNTWCQSVNLSDLFRNIRVISVTDTATTISAEHRDSINDAWGRFEGRVSNSMLVIPCGPPEKVEQIIINLEVSRRTRRKEQIEINWPATEFKMKDLLALYPDMSQPTLYLKVQEAIKNNLIKEVRREKIPGQKGKAPVVYSKVC